MAWGPIHNAYANTSGGTGTPGPEVIAEMNVCITSGDGAIIVPGLFLFLLAWSAGACLGGLRQVAPRAQQRQAVRMTVWRSGWRSRACIADLQVTMHVALRGGAPVSAAHVHTACLNGRCWRAHMNKLIGAVAALARGQRPVSRLPCAALQLSFMIPCGAAQPFAGPALACPATINTMRQHA